MTVSLILPTMNEVEGLKWFMPLVRREWYDQLLIMDAGSTDGTTEYCQANGYPIHQQKEKGLAAALAEGFALATGDCIVTASPDGNCKPEHLPQLIDEMKQGYDMVIVSRYFGTASSEDDDFMTKLGNGMFTTAVNLLFRGHYTDTLGIYRAYRRDSLKKMGLPEMHSQKWLGYFPPKIISWDLGSSIRAAKLRLKVKEIPGDEPARIGGERKLSIINNGLGALRQIVHEFFFW